MKSLFSNYVFLAIVSCFHLPVFAQVIEPDIRDTVQWNVVNRTAELANENGKKGIRLSEAPGDGLMILKGSDFSDGSIELDIKGSNKFQQSFVGFAFHVRDMKQFDAVYFRPFNFQTDDAARRSHAVQYISIPGNDWQKLRTDFPGRYENKIDAGPGPDDWFHAKIVVRGKRISVFVNNQQQASLEVDKLNNNTNGAFAFWVGNNSGGSFANLKITKANAVINASLTTPSIAIK